MTQERLKTKYPQLKQLSDLLNISIVITLFVGLSFVIYCLSNYNEYLSTWTCIPVMISSAFVALMLYFISKILWVLVSIDYHNKLTVELLKPKDDKKKDEGLQTRKTPNKKGMSINELYKQ